jgi:Uma2 family endonuclease
MATTTQVPVEVYLRSSEYEPAAEYVDGEIQERPMGELNHADWQQAILRWFVENANDWNIRTFAELRVNVSKENCRIPDVTVLDRSLPLEQTITHPPIAVFEILSAEDTVKKMKRKLADYAQMGIPQIWLVDPDSGSFDRYECGRLTPGTRFEHGSIQFDFAQIASLLQS